MAEPKVSAGVRTALTIAGVLIVLGTLIGGSGIGIVVTLLVAILVIYSMTQVPVRMSMFALIFFAIALPNPSEGLPAANYEPPFNGFGAIMLNHLNTVDRSIGATSWMSFSGMDLLFLTLGLILLYRHNTGSKIELIGRVPTPKPMLQLAWLSLATSGFVEFTGLVRGGNFNMSLWQLNSVMYLPMIFLLFQSSVRGLKDFQSLGKAVFAACTYKCLLAIYVSRAITVPPDPETGSTRPVFATSHTDSILFATCFAILIALLFERAGKRVKLYAAIYVPLIVLAVQANNRRIAWAEIGLSIAAIVLVSRPSPLKKKITRYILYSIPVLIIYVIAGWNSAYGAAFKPVRIIRSIADAKTDASSMWREYENVDIVATFRNNPILGTGYGHPYEEIVVLPHVDYPLERYTPHNSLLGLWCYSGYIGFAGLTMLWAGGVYFAMRAYRNGPSNELRAAALCSFCATVVYLMQAWGDIGLGTWTGVFSMAASLTVACKAAVASGQWGTTKPAR